MASLLNLKIGAKGKKTVSRGKLPVKRTINLAGVGENPIKVTVAAPAIILIVVAALLLSKFFVYDRLRAVDEAQHEAAAVQRELDMVYARMDSFGELSEQYAHYTYSDMTPEELNRADRVEVVTMIEEVIQPRAGMSAWTLVGNQISLTISGKSLEEINQLISLIEEQKWVDFCTVSNAMSVGIDPETGKEIEREIIDEVAKTTVVTSKITIYLRTPQEVSTLEDTQS